MNMGKDNHRKEKGIKIIDPKKVDYTFTEHSFNIKSSHMTMKRILAYRVNQKQKEKISID
jgi:hypothetical protein